MNVGIFTDTYYPEINGVANSAYELKQGLEDLGHQVYVFTVTHPAVKNKTKGVFRVTSVPCLLIKERRMGCPYTRSWMKKIAGLKLDIVHTQTEFMIGQLGRRAAQIYGIPHLHTYHTIYEDYTHYLKMPGNEYLKGVIRMASKKYCNSADGVIAPTEKVSELLKEYGVNRTVWEIASGINLDKFIDYDRIASERIRKQYGITDDQRVLISIGRLSREKNLAEVIDRFAGMHLTEPDTVLMIVGDGPERFNLEQRSRSLGIESRVIFTGMVPWSEIENFYGAGDIFVSASTSETQGLTYLEALACGKPLLVRNDPCLKNVLRHKENGFGYDSEGEFIKGYRYIIETITAKERFAADEMQWFGQSRFAGQVEEVYRHTMREKWRLKNGFSELAGTA